MHQPTLFQPQTPADAVSLPLARYGDPTTSHQAAEEITASGTRSHMCRVALELLREFPASTAAELDRIYSDRTGGPADGSIRKRLNDLRHASRALVDYPGRGEPWSIPIRDLQPANEIVSRNALRKVRSDEE